MGNIAVLVIKIMPESPSVNLDHIQHEATKRMEKHGAKNISFDVQPVAFGLKALVMKMAWPEENPTDLAEDELRSIQHVSSVNIEDYRRAFG